ncbi:HtaA domain-containing protein [uncultured Corynebacterium sp.]|uniref:HtaA domain-containing protein n=1 Tax=uncultured Corynebacterium sp. TaxID=159447 RepID=UPI0025D6C935|nr:HtaA domain-containing protein [uncultured Corynebacterium sp.]
MASRLISRLTSRTALAALTTASLLPLAAPASAAPATGHLTWGIRSSFTNYTGGATYVGDGARTTKQGFEFELTDVTYDPATKRTEAQFNGTVIYRKYCKDNSKPLTSTCDLDLHFDDPKVVLAPEGSYLEARVKSNQYQKGEVYAPATPVKVATLNPGSATFSNQDGRISWSSIAASLTSEGNTMFSGFYSVGSGLDPVSLSYEGQGGTTSEEAARSLSPATWDSHAAFDDGVHTLFDANPGVLVALPAGKGFALLDDDLHELATLPADTGSRGLVAYDAPARTLYYVEDSDRTQLKAVEVTGNAFGTPKTVFTASHDIYALGYHPRTHVVAAIVPSDAIALTATLVSGTNGAFTEAPLPDAAQLFPTTPLAEGAGFVWANSFAPKNQAELLPMSDGTFVYHGSVEPTFAGDTTSTKGLLYSIKPDATEVSDRARAMAGSRLPEKNMYLDNLTGTGNQLYRFNNLTRAEAALAQVLTYSSETRDVVPAGAPEAGVLPGWAAMGFEADGTPIQQNGVTGDLNWLTPGGFTVTDTFTLPNGRETSNVSNNSFLVRADGTIFVPTLDESRGDHVEYYVLRRIDPPKQQPAPEQPQENVYAKPSAEPKGNQKSDQQSDHKDEQKAEQKTDGTAPQAQPAAPQAPIQQDPARRGSSISTQWNGITATWLLPILGLLAALLGGGLTAAWMHLMR